MVKAYAAYAGDRKIRRESSSGGIFSLLAAAVIKKQGVVFGVCFDEAFHAVYKTAEKPEELEQFRGAKYAAPDMTGVFARVRACLDAGRYVLFSGLPCHCACLKTCLSGRGGDRLFTVDLVCHGIPEQAAWDAYLAYERRRLGDIRGICMRDKTKGWADYGISLTDAEGNVHREAADRNLFMKGYLADLYLKQACYSCRFKGLSRCTDITLGDYWGVSRRHPELDTAGGVSLVLIHSNKGAGLFEQLKEQIVFRETDADYAGGCNPSISSCAGQKKERRAFLENLGKGTKFEDCISPYLRRFSWRESAARIKKKLKYTEKEEKY